MRTHAIAGNGVSSGSDVDLVASLRLARVGCLFQSMLSISRAFQKQIQRIRISEASGIVSEHVGNVHCLKNVFLPMFRFSLSTLG